MSRAHQHSKLQLAKQIVPTDDNTVGVWHFDNHLYSSQGMKPIDTPVVEIVDGRFGKGVEIKAPSGHLTYPSILNPYEGTISVWFNTKTFSTAPAWAVIAGQTSAASYNSNYIDIAKNNNTNQIVCHYTDPSATAPSIGWSGASSTTVLANDTWYHLSFTWKWTSGSVVLNLYINGILERTSTYAVALAGPEPFGVGYHQGISRICNGIVDELRVDKVARTSDEIKAWYQSQSPFYDPMDTTGSAQ